MKTSFLNNYEINTLAKAIYSITSWFPNRQFLGIVDKLNRDFIANEKNILGTTKIDSYYDFFDFYNKVLENYVPEYPPERFPIDIGNVKFFSNGEFHKIFIGNGSEDIYEVSFIVESLINDKEDLKEIWHEILKYENLVISNLELFRSSFTQRESFECPPKDYFYFIFNKYDEFRSNKLEEYFRGFKSVNIELYEFFSPIKKLPIFLPLMKECFIELVEREAEREDFKKSIWRSFYGILNCNFPRFQKSGGNIFYNLKLIHKQTKVEFDLENTVAFLSENNLVILESATHSISNHIKEEIKNSVHQVAGLCQDGVVRVFEYRTDGNVEFIGVDTENISPNINNLHFSSRTDNIIFNASSVVGIINSAKDIKSIVDFLINYKKDSDKMISFANADAHFRTWQLSNQVINEGAADLTIIFFAYETVYFNMDFFDKIENLYPFELEGSFRNIHSWELIEKENTDLSLNSKVNSGSIDIFIVENKKIIYQEFDCILNDLELAEYEKVNFFNELILNSLHKNKNNILSNISGSFLQIKLVSQDILQKISQKGEKIKKVTYCDKITFYQDSANQTVFVAPRWYQIFEDNLVKKTLKFENQILLDVVSDFDFIDKNQMLQKIKLTDNYSRTSKLFEMEIKYFIQPTIKFSAPKSSSFKKVRKSISKVIKKLGLESGEYSEGNIQGVIKRFRNEIRDDLVAMMSLYNKDILNIEFQNILSSIIFEIDIHHKRIQTLIKQGDIQPDKLAKFQKDTIDLREEARTYKPILEYLIEENLISLRKKETQVPTKDIVDEMIAYGKYILNFQMLSDAYSYGASNWFKLEIEDNSVVNISETDQYLTFAEMMKKLKYKYGDYGIRDNELDNEMFKEVVQNFFIDTNIEYESLVCFLLLFSNTRKILDLEHQKKIEIKGNIISGKINDLAKYFVNNLDYSIEEFYKILNFLVLDIEKISTNNIIPIWEKKKRNNKISAKPIIIDGDKIVFSPAELSILEKEWTDGIMNFILPYDIGLQRTLNIIQKWKKYYENKIVKDLSFLFEDERYITYIDKELYKLDTKGNHPRDLGDYDLIVIDTKAKQILIIEIKYMRLSQTMKDVMGDQKEYFLSKKSKGNKFKRRVEYFQSKLDIICENVGLKGYYTLKAYFVTNKIIKSNFNEFPFEILSFNEFEDKINNVNIKNHQGE